jgi:2-polyprenyl-6-methoxyphenol hydroxylase-like FAD-dependent oxidoreductase
MTALRHDVDVVVAGGGIAGMTTAAALADLGLSVVVIEAGQHMERRLTGELLHPPGVAGLKALGLLGTFRGCAPAAVRGFAVFPPDGGPLKLDYAAGGGPALALDHVEIRRALRDDLAARADVELRLGQRVAAVEPAADAVIVAIEEPGGRSSRLRARLLVGADGAASPVRRLAGIPCRRRRVSIIHGFVVPTDALPCPDYGNVFFGKDGPILAYAIGQERARVLFDHRIAPPVDGAAACRADLDLLPPALADALRQATAAQRLLGFATQLVEVENVVRGRVVLVGDAAGTCHPLTASGMTASIADAISLRDALRARPDDIAAALRRHRRARRTAQLTRMALATALHEIYCGGHPGLQVLRLGVLRYWRSEERNRSRSMGLLSTKVRGRLPLAAAMARVALHGLAAWHAEQRRARGLDLAELAAVSGALAATFARHSRSLWMMRLPFPAAEAGLAEQQGS